MRDPALRASDFRLFKVMGIKGMEVDNSEKERAKEDNSQVKKKFWQGRKILIFDKV